tara:strand:+ start:2494 stop:2682 length:189 start_codon:yes stop_codon:yes gene_type:complete
MKKEKLLDCLLEVSNHLGSNMFQIVDEDEMIEDGVINNHCEELEEAVDKAINIIKLLPKRRI